MIFCLNTVYFLLVNKFKRLKPAVTVSPYKFCLCITASCLFFLWAVELLCFFLKVYVFRRNRWAESDRQGMKNDLCWEMDSFFVLNGDFLESWRCQEVYWAQKIVLQIPSHRTTYCCFNSFRFSTYIRYSNIDLLIIVSPKMSNYSLRTSWSSVGAADLHQVLPPVLFLL